MPGPGSTFFGRFSMILRGAITQSSAGQGVKVPNAEEQLHDLVVMATGVVCINAGHSGIES